MFVPSRGSRENVAKVLIVITDGESQEKNQLPNAAAAAERKKIVRFAIGVNFNIFIFTIWNILCFLKGGPARMLLDLSFRNSF